MDFRPATEADYSGIRAVNIAAFGRDDESDLVEALRADGDVSLEYVACDETGILGHILYSRLIVETETDTPIHVLALAPMAVRPDVQGTGIGSKLIRATLDACKAARIDAVIVLGHPDYYPRFGFLAEAARHLNSVYSAAGDAFMAQELVPGALRDAGKVTYPEAFAGETAEPKPHS